MITELINLNQEGGCNVFNKKEEINYELVRALDFLIRQNGLIENCHKYQMTLDILSDYGHTSIPLLKSTIAHVAILSKPNQREELPQWINLLLHNKSLRKFSKQYLNHIDEHFEFFGLKSFTEISSKRITCPHVAYNTANFKLCQLLINGRENFEPLHWRIKIHQSENFDESDIISILDSNIDENEKAAIVSYGTLKIFKTKKTKNIFFEKIVREQKTLEFNIRLIVMNVQNYIDMHTNKSMVLKNFDTTESIIREIPDTQFQRHAYANLYYQKGIFEDKSSNHTAITSYLRSHELEEDFYDVNYRIASSFHDLGSSNAKTYYERALSLSPLDKNLVNDYGVFLKDFCKENEFYELVNLYSKLGIISI